MVFIQCNFTFIVCKKSQSFIINIYRDSRRGWDLGTSVHSFFWQTLLQSGGEGGRLPLCYRLVSATFGDVSPCLSISSFSVMIFCSGVLFKTVPFSIAISIFLRLPIESRKRCATTCFLSSNASVYSYFCCLMT